MSDASPHTADRFANDPHARVVYKPVAPKNGSPASSAPPMPDPFVRAENEDDDGYDPYSDRHEKTPLFEENPWD